MKLVTSLCFTFCLATVIWAQPKRTTLDIYYVDVEGGASTLIVTPAGESILVDAGWPGFDGRDAKRIQVAMQQAGIKQIDHLVLTHYHTDHFGGIPEIAKLVPIKNFYNHGPMTKLDEDRNFEPKYQAYRAAAKDQTITLKPGDQIKLQQAAGLPPLTLQCIAARRQVFAKPTKAVLNKACTDVALQAEDPSDNAASVALWLRFGNFDFYDAGDLTWNIEQQLVCPSNKLGIVDLYQVTHHGANTSNNVAVLKTLQPTVAIMNNGPRKGGHPDVFQALRTVTSLKALYAVHRNITTTAAQNADEALIANLDEQNDQAHMITVAVNPKSKNFAVTNGRTKETRTFSIK